MSPGACPDEVGAVDGRTRHECLHDREKRREKIDLSNNSNLFYQLSPLLCNSITQQLNNSITQQLNNSATLFNSLFHLPKLFVILFPDYRQHIYSLKMSKIKYYIASFRLRTLPLSLSGIFLGTLLAASEGYFNWAPFLLAVVTTHRPDSCISC